MYRIDDATASPTLPTPEAALAEGYWTEGNPGTGTPATLLRASFMNMVQEELRAIVVAAGLTPSKTTYNQVLSAILKVAAGAYEVRGLVAQNNTTTPNTQFDVKADAAVFRNPTTGATTAVSNVTTVTNNILTAGSAANGRDQAGAFTASSWVHFYLIYNGTTVATLSSASAPPTGPTLPTGYTSWAYVGAVFLNASSNLLAVRFRGSWATYDLRQLVVNGTSVSLATVSVAGVVPPNALNFQLACAQLSITSTGTGVSSVLLGLEVVSGSADFAYATTLQNAGTASAQVSANAGSPIMPNIGQQYFYIMNITAGTGPATTHYVTGYKMPNGGE